MDKLFRFEKIEIDIVGLEFIFVTRNLVDLYTDILEQFDEVIHIEDVRDVADAHGIRGEERGANHFERLVLGSLGID